MHVVCPADAMEVRSLVTAALEHCKPTFIRLGKKGEPQVHEAPPPLKIGKGFTVRVGKDLALLSVGNMLPVALDCAEKLQLQGVSTQVISWHTIKPMDENLLQELFELYPKIILLEEHGLAGGAGSAVLEWGCQQRVDLRKLHCFAGRDQFLSACGNQQQARTSLGLTAQQLVSRLLELL